MEGKRGSDYVAQAECMGTDQRHPLEGGGGGTARSATYTSASSDVSKSPDLTHPVSEFAVKKASSGSLIQHSHSLSFNPDLTHPL